MIQFNRYKLPDETHDFHAAFVNLVNTLAAEINGDCHRSIGLLLSLAERFPLNDRLPCVAARMFYWGKVSWNTIEKMMPARLPSNLLYKQEMVGCLGFAKAASKWGITEDQWNLYQGFSPDYYSYQPLPSTAKVVSYQPRNSGFFSVIENIIAAQIMAHFEGNKLVIDLTGNWWCYEESFEDIFGDTFEYTKDGTLPQMRFELMRHRLQNTNDDFAWCYMDMKKIWYNQIFIDISHYISCPDVMVSAGVMFVRGGDKLQTETILPPMKFLLRDLKWMARRCDDRFVLSDDKHVGEAVAALDSFVLNRSNQVEGGYHHTYGKKVSCLNILRNYLTMVEAKENMSCPSTNLVNAAQWTRNDQDNYSLSNPVYRYLLI